VDFEEVDALVKLRRLGVVTENEGRYRPLPLKDAVLKLDDIWDGLFPEKAHTMNEGALRLAKQLEDDAVTKAHTLRF
jgi:hypothetical protein